MKSTLAQIMASRTARLFTFTSIILIAPVCGLVRQKYEAPRPAPTSADVVRLAEPIPAELTAASKTAFDSGLKFFIWRDGEGTVLIRPNGNERIEIHFAVAPGTEPSPFEALLRMNARVRGTNALNTIFTSVGSRREVTQEVFLSNEGSFQQFKGEGTAEVYFNAYDSMGDPRYIVPISNVIKIQVNFE
jgi:hypothetical protein